MGIYIPRPYLSSKQEGIKKKSIPKSRIPFCAYVDSIQRMMTNFRHALEIEF